MTLTPLRILCMRHSLQHLRISARIAAKPAFLPGSMVSLKTTSDMKEIVRISLPDVNAVYKEHAGTEKSRCSK